MLGRLARSCSRASKKPGKVLATHRLEDDGAGRAQAEDGERHRHAVVVVGLDAGRRRPLPGGRDGEAVGLLDGVDTAALQLRDDRVDAIGSPCGG